MDGGNNTYGYALGDPLSYVDRDGLSPYKIIVLCERGYKVIRNVNFKEAVRALRRGQNGLSNTEQKSKQVARAASRGAGKPIKDTAHKDGYMPHYHMFDRSGGHSFYSIASAVSLAHYKSCDKCISGYVLEAADFFNPLTLPKDLMDLANDLTDDE